MEEIFGEYAIFKIASLVGGGISYLCIHSRSSQKEMNVEVSYVDLPEMR